MRNVKMIQLFMLLASLCAVHFTDFNFTDRFIDFRNASKNDGETGLVFANWSYTACALNLPDCLIDLVTRLYLAYWTHRPCPHSSLSDCFIDLNESGHPDATGMTYAACRHRKTCGPHTEAPTWANISQQFSAWLLPYLALISQLPFGSRHRVDNFMSAILTVGSPVLAGYSMIITILNARWIIRRFEKVSFPNAVNAVRILISLQQSPLRITNEDSLFSSLVVLPDNDEWWSKTAEFLDYTHTWSIASATAIAWVIIAYILTVANSLSDPNINSNGQGTGLVWLWLIPIVIGWLQLSPKCDHSRIQRAMDNADAMAFVATHDGIAKASELSERRGISIDTIMEKPSSPDEDLTPPVYNYARAMPWSRSAEDALDAFRMASKNAKAHIPVEEGAVWVNSVRRNDIELCNRLGNPYEVDSYCQLPGYKVRSPWASGIFFRMFAASLLPLALQWATTGAAVLIVWYTPTVGLSCRSLGYLLYGAMSTIVWIMLILSSILSHYTSSYQYRPQSPFSSVRLAKVPANVLRWGGKLLAIINALGIIAHGMLQFAGVYDNCFCNSSVLWLGIEKAYVVIYPSVSQVNSIIYAWRGALVLGSCSSVGFIFFMSLLTDLLPT